MVAHVSMHPLHKLMKMETYLPFYQDLLEKLLHQPTFARPDDTPDIDTTA
jgi:hypothetical protein